MEVEEIYEQAASHMIKGIMTHEQLCQFYDFLGLNQYKKCHEEHLSKEYSYFRKLNTYYINHYNELIKETEIQNPKIISPSWYNHKRQDVDTDTKRASVEKGVRIWVEWEKTTKTLYQKLYKELFQVGEIASAHFFMELIKGVDEELEEAQKYHLKLESINYAIEVIINQN